VPWASTPGSDGRAGVYEDMLRFFVYSRSMAELPLIPASRLLRYECPEDRGRMAERGRGHYCTACDKEVVDMSRLTIEQAVEAVRTAPARTCSSYAMRDGALAFRAARRAGGTVVISIATFLTACRSNAPSEEAAEAALRAAPSAAPSSPALPAPATVASVSPAEALAAEPVASAAPGPSASAACEAKASPPAGHAPRAGAGQKHSGTVLIGY
jgi:hypothetical protein